MEDWGWGSGSNIFISLVLFVLQSMWTCCIDVIDVTTRFNQIYSHCATFRFVRLLPPAAQLSQPQPFLELNFQPSESNLPRQTKRGWALSQRHRRLSATCLFHRGLPQLQLPLVLHSGAAPAGQMRARLHTGMVFRQFCV